MYVSTYAQLREYGVVSSRAGEMWGVSGPYSNCNTWEHNAKHGGKILVTIMTLQEITCVMNIGRYLIHERSRESRAGVSYDSVGILVRLLAVTAECPATGPAPAAGPDRRRRPHRRKRAPLSPGSTGTWTTTSRATPTHTNPVSKGTLTDAKRVVRATTLHYFFPDGFHFWNLETCFFFIKYKAIEGDGETALRKNKQL